MSLSQALKRRFYTGTALQRLIKYRRLKSTISTWTEQDEAMRRHYSQFLGPEDTAFDVGANVGTRTKIFARICKGVIAVEPQTAVAGSLKRLFARDPRVVVVNSALGACEGTIEMAISNISTISSLSKDWVEAVKKSGRFGAGASWDRTETVQVTTLDKLIEQFGVPGFIKVDVEGYEREVLSGLHRPVKTLSFEFTPERLEQSLAILTQLAQLGRIESNYALGDTPSLIFSEWIAPEQLATELLKFREDTETFADIYVRFM